MQQSRGGWHPNRLWVVLGVCWAQICCVWSRYGRILQMPGVCLQSSLQVRQNHPTTTRAQVPVGTFSPGIERHLFKFFSNWKALVHVTPFYVQNWHQNLPLEKLLFFHKLMPEELYLKATNTTRVLGKISEDVVGFVGVVLKKKKLFNDNNHSLYQRCLHHIFLFLFLGRLKAPSLLFDCALSPRPAKHWEPCATPASVWDKDDQGGVNNPNFSIFQWSQRKCRHRASISSIPMFKHLRNFSHWQKIAY